MQLSGIVLTLVRSSSKDDKSKMESASVGGSTACEANPSAPGCAEASASRAAKATDPLAQVSAAHSAQTDYNSGDTSGASAGPASMGAVGNGANGPSVKPIANNTGGGIPAAGTREVSSVAMAAAVCSVATSKAGSPISTVSALGRAIRTRLPTKKSPMLANGFSGYGTDRDPRRRPMAWI